MILWENCAYLVDDAMRAATFERLSTKIGIEPPAIIASGPKAIAGAIEGGGMKPLMRAQKVLRCAEIAIEYADADLAGTLKRSSDQARRRLLKRFPGIGEPGVDRVLLICGYSNRPALESNALRVLERIGYISPSPSYATQYRSAVNFVSRADVDPLDAYVLLRTHGKETCKRSKPLCMACPLQRGCAFGRAR